MGKELPRSIGALHKVHGIALRRFRLDDGNKNGIKIWKVGKGRQFPSPDEGAEKEETELDLDFFSEAVATQELPTPAYPTQDEPEVRSVREPADMPSMTEKKTSGGRLLIDALPEVAPPRRRAGLPKRNTRSPNSVDYHTDRGQLRACSVNPSQA